MKKDSKLNKFVRLLIWDIILIFICWLIARVSFITDFYTTDLGDVIDKVNYYTLIILVFCAVFLTIIIIVRLLINYMKK